MLLVAAVLAILPDSDYLFYKIFNWGEEWHRSFTHSIFFAVVCGSAVAIAFGKPSLMYFLVFTLATLSHPLLDAFVSEGGGVQLAWPLSAHYFHFGLVQYPNLFKGQPSSLRILIRVLQYSLVEASIFAPPFALILWFRSSVRH